MGPGMGSFFSSLSVGCVMTRTGAPVGEIWGAGWVGGTIFGDIIIHDQTGDEILESQGS